jgi:hypothetical protein
MAWTNSQAISDTGPALPGAGASRVPRHRRSGFSGERPAGGAGDAQYAHGISAPVSGARQLAHRTGLWRLVRAVPAEGARTVPFTSATPHGCGSLAVRAWPGAAGSCGACGTRQGRAVYHGSATSPLSWPPQRHSAVAADGQGQVTGGICGTSVRGRAGGKTRGPGSHRPPGSSPGKSRTHVPVSLGVCGCHHRGSRTRRGESAGFR